MEEWRVYGDISVSNLGNVSTRVYSCTTGYQFIMYKGKKILVHRLVAELFLGEVPEDYVVHHIDRVNWNNRVDNLLILSRSEHSRIHSNEMVETNRDRRARRPKKEEPSRVRAPKIDCKALSKEHFNKMCSGWFSK